MDEPLEFQLDCVEDEIANLDKERSRLIQELVYTDMNIKKLKNRREYILFEMGG